MSPTIKQHVFNDPIYGFIRIQDPLLLSLIESPYFQRLRRISQLGLSSLVYPGAQHTRFHHALGCLHLMQKAIFVLRSKGVAINEKEEQALQIAILLHDIGHGPFSHAMEHSIIHGLSHEQLTIRFMDLLNETFHGALDLGIKIFKGESKRLFFNQLVASQLDMDRLDYLKRDSFYTGVSEGNINSERLISMLNVVEDILVVEEKGLYSVEKFLMARRFMYWQVYLHKTSMVAEHMLIKIFERAKFLVTAGEELYASKALAYFLKRDIQETEVSSETMHYFSMLDDVDIYAALKEWCSHSDFVLSRLSAMVMERKLLKISVQEEAIEPELLEKKLVKVQSKLKISKDLASYFVFKGLMTNAAYLLNKHPIYISKKGEKKIDMETRLAPPFLNALSKRVEKHYICFPKKGF
ncbi:HD domain-containing protein [Flavobacteriaceae bacterium LSUCC0859]|nr:HD domain-containing protein [Flavobacteriaceae bacterium LSUCC0859]